jgi:hypothetical protein
MPATQTTAETCNLCGTTTANTYHTMNNGEDELNYCSPCRDYRRDQDYAGMLHDGPLPVVVPVAAPDTTPFILRERDNTNDIKLSETRSVGIEIECKVPVDLEDVAAALRHAGLAAKAVGYGGCHISTDYWKVTTDASVYNCYKDRTVNGETQSVYFYGMELVSPMPFAGKAAVKQLKTVCKVLKQLGAVADSQCGLHVHHDAHDLSMSAWKNLARFYVKYEKTLDSFVPPSRRGNSNSMCKSLSAYYAPSALYQRIDNAYDVSGIQGVWGHDRFLKLNTVAYSAHGSVEIRHQGGTVDIQKMLNWLSFTQCIVEAAAQGMTVSERSRDIKAHTIYKMVKPPRTVRWFLDRRAATLAA